MCRPATDRPETQEKAITLLKNRGNALPLTARAKKIRSSAPTPTINAIGGGRRSSWRRGRPRRSRDPRAGFSAGANVSWVRGNDPANGANMLETADMTAVPSTVLSPNNGQGTGLNAWFWKDTNFQGDPDEQRIARQVNYDVGILSTLDTPGPSQVPPPPVSCATCPGSAVYEGHITAPKTGRYTLALTGMGDATLDIDGQRVATMQGADNRLAHAETPTLNWVKDQSHTLRVTFRGIHPFEILNDGSVLLSGGLRGAPTRRDPAGHRRREEERCRDRLREHDRGRGARPAVTEAAAGRRPDDRGRQHRSTATPSWCWPTRAR